MTSWMFGAPAKTASIFGAVDTSVWFAFCLLLPSPLSISTLCGRGCDSRWSLVEMFGTGGADVVVYVMVPLQFALFDTACSCYKAVSIGEEEMC
jgi:hypothetical protein